MPTVTERLKWLNGQLDALTNTLDNSVNTEERKEVLRRMKFLINEIDLIIHNSLFQYANSRRPARK